MLELAMRFIAGLLVLIVSVCPIAAQRTNAPAPLAPGRLVRVGTRQLHINCTGQGQPTVILVHGTGAFSFDWSLVQPEVAKLTRVCSYDRAGHAWSDLAPTSQTYSEMAKDLHDLLKTAGEKAPAVLVGHSGGGAVVRVFAAQYGSEVAGAVLVETGHPDSLSIINGRLIRMTADTMPPDPVAIDGPRTLPPNPNAEIGPPYDKLPMEAQAFRLWSEREGKAPASGRPSLELKSINELREAHARGAALFAQKPLVVISRAKGGYRPIRGIVTAEQAEEMERGRLNHIADLQKLSSNAIAVMAEKSGHDVHLDQPGLVIEAIHRVVDSIRENRRLATSQ